MTITSRSRPLFTDIFQHGVLDVIAFRVQADSENELARLTATNRLFGSVDGTRVIGDGHLLWGRFWGHRGHRPIQHAEIELGPTRWKCHKAPNAILACLLYDMS